MLDPHELQEIAARFGVDEHQMRSDHLISHLLAALSTELADSVIFFGDTALVAPGKAWFRTVVGAGCDTVNG